MTTDPAPHLTPHDAYERLADWRRQMALLMAKRDPLVRAAVTGRLGVPQSARASGLTPQTVRRLGGRDDIPLLGADHHSGGVDWDEYADYLETLGAAIRDQLATIPAPPGGRTHTTDDLRAELLIRLADRLRDTELSDAAHWALTVELRQEAEEDPALAVRQEQWTESADSAAFRAERVRTLTEVADQITAYRTEGPDAIARLDAAVLARARSELAPPPSTAALGSEVDDGPPQSVRAQ